MITAYKSESTTIENFSFNINNSIIVEYYVELENLSNAIKKKSSKSSKTDKKDEKMVSTGIKKLWCNINAALSPKKPKPVKDILKNKAIDGDFKPIASTITQDSLLSSGFSQLNLKIKKSTIRLKNSIKNEKINNNKMNNFFLNHLNSAGKKSYHPLKTSDISQPMFFGSENPSRASPIIGNADLDGTPYTYKPLSERLEIHDKLPQQKNHFSNQRIPNDFFENSYECIDNKIDKNKLYQIQKTAEKELKESILNGGLFLDFDFSGNEKLNALSEKIVSQYKLLNQIENGTF
ncbi:hypothetical protein QEN19_001243 [Hanseniaspora menglaensis]